ncbi:glycosyltransferase family 2 protein [Ferruginibacter yonginensis]|uniref:Glycosyltransferase family 2 protein n=1 Tax=Ferruginibacter yonginensis TaxID=1310416 RepID=A0ABV8QP53_9BACT
METLFEKFRSYFAVLEISLTTSKLNIKWRNIVVPKLTIFFMLKKISILLPVLNEQENILFIYNKINANFEQLSQYEWELIFIDDGSSDNTLSIIKDVITKHQHISYISFSRNFGKDNALMAGMDKATGDALITMDADLQHCPSLINELIKQWENGWEVVYYYRKSDNVYSSLISKLNSKLFYKVMNIITNVSLENGISDFRILDKNVVKALLNLKEDNPFFRGLIKWVGFKQLALPYNPVQRYGGRSSYKPKVLVKLAINSITSFSTKPLTLAIYIGFVFSFLSVLYIPYAIFSKMCHIAISGWTSIIVTIAFFGGLNLMVMGIIGLYLGKTFMQSKGRPSYIIRETNFN